MAKRDIPNVSDVTQGATILQRSNRDCHRLSMVDNKPPGVLLAIIYLSRRASPCDESPPPPCTQTSGIRARR